MVHGGQGDISTSVPVSWQELPAHPGYATRETNQFISQVLLPLEKKLLPVFPHGQAGTQEWPQARVRGGELGGANGMAAG